MTMGEPAPRQGVRRLLRLLLALAFLFLSLLILLIVLQLTESALSIWQMLDELSPALLALYGAGLVGFSLTIAVVGWQLLRPRRRGAEQSVAQTSAPIDRQGLEQALESAEQAGIDTREARLELQELERRSVLARHHLIFFGPVSSGKSSLIRAITGERAIATDVRAGTTQQVEHFRFSRDDLGEVVLTDAPGILDLDDERVRIAREEARRADLIVYVCEGELTRDQFTEVSRLQAYERPLLLAVNKPDRYSEADLQAVLQRLAEQLPGVGQVVVQAGGRETLVRIDADGRETTLERERPARIEPLLQAVRQRLAQSSSQLTRLRDESLMRLGADKLAQATASHRLAQSELVVKSYARKAMVGAMAAVSPGTDVLIQGYLGVQMVRELTRRYEVKATQADLDQFVALASRQVGRRLTLLLSLAGNVLKAFPGIGTVTGGLMHAVAYGMIFEGLGRAVARTLHESGELQRRQALDYFEETIGGDLESRAKVFARLAWEEFVTKR